MDVDGEAKAQRKVSPLTFLPVFIFIFIFFLYQVLSFFSLPSFLLVVVIKERRRRKKGGGHLSFSRPGRLLRVCTSVRRSSVAARRCFPTLLMLAQWAYREGRRRDAAAEEEGKKPKRERIFNWHLPPLRCEPIGQKRSSAPSGTVFQAIIEGGRRDEDRNSVDVDCSSA